MSYDQPSFERAKTHQVDASRNKHPSRRHLSLFGPDWHDANKHIRTRSSTHDIGSDDVKQVGMSVEMPTLLKQQSSTRTMHGPLTRVASAADDNILEGLQSSVYLRLYFSMIGALPLHRFQKQWQTLLAQAHLPVILLLAFCNIYRLVKEGPDSVHFVVLAIISAIFYMGHAYFFRYSKKLQRIMDYSVNVHRIYANTNLHSEEDIRQRSIDEKALVMQQIKQRIIFCLVASLCIWGPLVFVNADYDEGDFPFLTSTLGHAGSYAIVALSTFLNSMAFLGVAFHISFAYALLSRQVTMIMEYMVEDTQAIISREGPMALAEQVSRKGGITERWASFYSVLQENVTLEEEARAWTACGFSLMFIAVAGVLVVPVFDRGITDTDFLDGQTFLVLVIGAICFTEMALSIYYAYRRFHLVARKVSIALRINQRSSNVGVDDDPLSPTSDTTNTSSGDSKSGQSRPKRKQLEVIPSEAIIQSITRSKAPVPSAKPVMAETVSEHAVSEHAGAPDVSAQEPSESQPEQVPLKIVPASSMNAIDLQSHESARPREMSISYDPGQDTPPRKLSNPIHSAMLERVGSFDPAGKFIQQPVELISPASRRRLSLEQLRGLMFRVDPPMVPPTWHNLAAAYLNTVKYAFPAIFLYCAVVASRLVLQFPSCYKLLGNRLFLYEESQNDCEGAQFVGQIIEGVLNTFMITGSPYYLVYLMLGRKRVRSAELTLFISIAVASCGSMYGSVVGDDLLPAACWFGGFLVNFSVLGWHLSKQLGNFLIFKLFLVCQLAICIIGYAYLLVLTPAFLLGSVSQIIIVFFLVPMLGICCRQTMLHVSLELARIPGLDEKYCFVTWAFINFGVQAWQRVFLFKLDNISAQGFAVLVYAAFEVFARGTGALRYVTAQRLLFGKDELGAWKATNRYLKSTVRHDIIFSSIVGENVCIVVSYLVVAAIPAVYGSPPTAEANYQRNLALLFVLQLVAEAGSNMVAMYFETNRLERYYLKHWIDQQDRFWWMILLVVFDAAIIARSFYVLANSKVTK